MADDRFPSLHEDLSADPLHERVQAVLAEMVAEGHDPKDVATAAMTTGSALSLDVVGLVRTAVYLMHTGATLAQIEPELREAAAQFAAVLAHVNKPARPGPVAADARH